MSVGFYGGAINPNHVKASMLIFMTFLDNIPEQTALTPALKARIDGVPFAKIWRQITPWNASAKDI